MFNLVKRQLKNEKGAALILVLIALFVTMLLGTSVYFFSTNALHVTQTIENQKKAQLLAYSGGNAVKRMWLESEDKDIFENGIDTVYLTANGDYTTDGSAENILGEVNVNVNVGVQDNEQDNGNRWTIHATGTIYVENNENVKQEIKLSSEEIEDEENTDKYIEKDDHWLWGVRWFWEPGSIEETNDDGDVLKRHEEVSGAIKIEHDDTLQLRRDNDRNKVGIAAKSIFIDADMDLRLNFPYQGALVVSAENIVLDGDLYVREGSLSGGLLILHVPDGLGYSGEMVLNLVADEDKDKVDVNATYGKVFFGKDVSIDGSINNQLSAKNFWFKQDNDEGVRIGSHNLFSGSKPRLIEIKDTDGNVVLHPQIEDTIDFFIR